MLQIEIDNGSGFCFGVTTAIKKAEEELAKGNQLYCLGDIVHNGMECERLRQMGLITINHEEMERLHNVKVLLRAHGEPPATYELARRNNIEIIDATCPVVLQLQKRIKAQYENSQPPTQKELSSEESGSKLSTLNSQLSTIESSQLSTQKELSTKESGSKLSTLNSQLSTIESSQLSTLNSQLSTQIVIFGKNGHAEVLGLVGQTQGQAIVIEKFDDVKRLDFTHDIYLYSQTTKSLDEFHRIIEYIQEHISPTAHFQSFDTICRQVANRMPNISAFASRHDLILFVCGRKSSNGKVLFNECLRVNPNSHLIEGPEEICQEWLEGIQTIGICGATSTPKWLMEQCSEAIAVCQQG